MTANKNGIRIDLGKYVITSDDHNFILNDHPVNPISVPKRPTSKSILGYNGRRVWGLMFVLALGVPCRVKLSQYLNYGQNGLVKRILLTISMVNTIIIGL